MKKRALRKDFYMEIRRNPGRFISIFLIVALGVAFYAGIQSAAPDMRYTGDTYFDESNLMDIKVQGTLGLTEEDVDALESLEGIADAEPGYSTDVLYKEDGENDVFHVESLTSEMNQVDILEGEAPAEAGECLLDVRYAGQKGYGVGDVLTVEEELDEDEDPVLTTHTYTVTGIASSPLYIGTERGSSILGSGEVTAFMYVTEGSFDLDVYTQIYLTVEGAKEETAYLDAYTDIVENAIKELEAIEDERCEARYEEVVSEAEEAIADARQELEEKEAEADEQLADAQAEIDDAQQQLDDGNQELADAREEIEDAKKTLEENEAQLASSKQELADGQAQLASAKQELTEQEAEFEEQKAEAEEEIASGEKQIKKARKKIAKNQATLTEKEEELEAAQAEYEESKQALEESKQQIEVSKQQLETWKTQYEQLSQAAPDSEETAAMAQQIAAAEAQITEAEAQIAAGEEQLAQAEAQLTEGEKEIKAAQKEINKATKEVDAQEKELESAKKELSDGEDQIESAWAEIAANEAELANAQAQISDGEAQIEEGWQEIADAEAEIAEGEEEIAGYQEDLEEGRQEYEDAKAEAEEKIAEAEEKIDDAQREVDDIEVSEWYITDRDDLPDYTGLGDNADRMKNIGEVFPALFFLVAALISLTTMTRMVEEQRTQIGTLKALGYSKASIAAKYLGYALLATIGGSVFGVLFGEKFLPYVIIRAYGILYTYVPIPSLPYNMKFAIIASLVAVLCTLIATLAACYRELASTPALLMRPPAPKQGKRVFLEHVPFLWKRLNFSWKSTVRNLFRYKKRFFMTIFGISGCMALLLVGYGLRDSIMNIAVIQYDSLQTYDAMIVLDDDADEEEEDELNNFLEDAPEVQAYDSWYMKNLSSKNGDESRDLYLVIPEDTEKFPEFVTLRNRKNHEGYTLSDEGIVLTEKTAKMLGVSVGDAISLELGDGEWYDVTITAVCENYMYHYAYMTPALYEELIGKAPEYGTIVYSMDETDRDAIQEIGEKALSYSAALGLTYTSSYRESLNDMLGALDSVMYVLIISAGLLAFVVLYNLNNININERRRELATLKVLGFYDGEVGAYVYRENVVLTVLGAALGCVLGAILHRFVIVTVEVDVCMFGRNINPSSFLYAVLFTVAFSVIVNFVMFFKLRKIDMVESLKSVE